MDIKIRNDKQNKSLERREIEFFGEGEKTTPARKEVLESLAQKLAVNEKFIMVKRIENVYGSHEFEGTANVYSSKERMNQLESPYLQKRNGVQEEAKKKEAAVSKKEEKKDA